MSAQNAPEGADALRPEAIEASTSAALAAIAAAVEVAWPKPA